MISPPISTFMIKQHKRKTSPLNKTRASTLGGCEGTQPALLAPGLCFLINTESTVRRALLEENPLYNHFNHERHLNDQETFKLQRNAALAEWQQLGAA